MEGGGRSARPIEMPYGKLLRRAFCIAFLKHISLVGGPGSPVGLPAKEISSKNAIMEALHEQPEGRRPPDFEKLPVALRGAPCIAFFELKFF